MAGAEGRAGPLVCQRSGRRGPGSAQNMPGANEPPEINCIFVLLRPFCPFRPIRLGTTSEKHPPSQPEAVAD
jgi:hypothetical protein